MPLDGPPGQPDDTTEVGVDDQGGGPETQAKVIVRSNGTVTYVGKDIAYQFWKFGLLGKDFYYQIFNDSDSNHLVWTTSAKRVTDIEAPPLFGSGSTVYNVIDTRQTYLQKLIQQALIAIHHKTEANNSIHFSYEMVALSRATALALEPNSDVDLKRPFVEVSGRKGLGVKADDLLDRITETAKTEVSKRNPNISSEEHVQIAETIGSAAVRYFMIKYSRTKIIAFDIDFSSRGAHEVVVDACLAVPVDGGKDFHLSVGVQIKTGDVAELELDRLALVIAAKGNFRGSWQYVAHLDVADDAVSRVKLLGQIGFLGF